MGVFTRPRSPWYWLWLENAPPGHEREKTAIRVGKTATERKDSRAVAEQVYATRVLELARNVHRLPTARPVIRFRDFAAWYRVHVSATRRGAVREAEIIDRLVRAFGDVLLHHLDRARVIEWRTLRAATPTTIDAFGSRKKAPKWRDVHRWLQEEGPQPLPAIGARFGLTPKATLAAFWTRQTAPYFARVDRGRYAAVGTPSVAARTLPPPKPSTINREVDLLQQMLSAAVPLYLDANPLVGLPNLRTPPPQRRTMSPEEEARVLAELAPVDRAIVLVGLDTLTRLGDILELRRRDDDGETLHIRDPKNGVPHRVRISARLRAALDALTTDAPAIAATAENAGNAAAVKDWYFPSRRRAGSEASRRSVIRGALRRACQRAGVPYGRAQNGLTFHWATRRTGASRIIRAYGDGGVALAQRIGGWKDLSVLIEMYQETTTEELQAAVDVIGQSTPTQPAPAKKRA